MNTTQTTSQTASTTVSDARVGLIVRLQARPEQAQEVAAVLGRGRAMVEDEHGTPVWFAFQISEHCFGIYDAFADDAARTAHLEGELAAVIVGRADELLSEAPRIETVDLLGAKVVAGTVPSAIAKGLSARLVAKAGSEEVVESLLRAGQEMVEREAATPVWYAFRIDAQTFGIFDAFADDAGRKAHLDGALAAALVGRADELLAQPPTIEAVDIVEGKLVHG